MLPPSRPAASRCPPDICFKWFKSWTFPFPKQKDILSDVLLISWTRLSTKHVPPRFVTILFPQEREFMVRLRQAVAANCPLDSWIKWFKSGTFPFPKQKDILSDVLLFWRYRPDLNWGMRVLQTLALPLGHGTIWKSGTRGVPDSFVGAGDEARTRYLHLGKVALYRMSYTRIWCLRSELNQRHADFQSAALPTELQRHVEQI